MQLKTCFYTKHCSIAEHNAIHGRERAPCTQCNIISSFSDRVASATCFWPLNRSSQLPECHLLPPHACPLPIDSTIRSTNERITATAKQADRRVYYYVYCAKTQHVVHTSKRKRLKNTQHYSNNTKVSTHIKNIMYKPFQKLTIRRT